MTTTPDSIVALQKKVDSGTMEAGAEKFARSMLHQFGKKGELSEKQMEWVEKLAQATPGEKNDNIDFLRTNDSNLSKSEKEFARSLIQQWDAKGFLSPKQIWWVGQLCGKAKTDRTTERGPTSAGREPAPELKIVQTETTTLVNVELRPGVWAVIDTKSNTILGTYDTEADAQQTIDQ